jgi:hypothetical protein
MRSPFRVTVLAALALAVFVLPSLVEVVTDWWWFDELGHQATYATVRAQATLGGIALLCVARPPDATCASPHAAAESQVSMPEGPTLACRAARRRSSWPARLRSRPSSGKILGWQGSTTDPILGFDVAFYASRCRCPPCLRSRRSAWAGRARLPADNRDHPPACVDAAIGLLAAAPRCWRRRGSTGARAAHRSSGGAGYTDVHSHAVLAEAGGLPALRAAPRRSLRGVGAQRRTASPIASAVERMREAHPSTPRAEGVRADHRARITGMPS